MKTLPLLVCVAALLLCTQITLAQNTFPANGKVGVNTATPSKELEVIGETKLKGDAEIVGKTTVSGELNVAGSSTFDGDAIVTGSFRLDSEADTQYPGERHLTINPNGTIKAVVDPSYLSNTYPCKQSATNPNPTAFWRSGPSKLYIDCPDNANVGIQTDTPQEALDVNGKIAVSDGLCGTEADGSLELYGNSNNSNGAYIKLYGDAEPNGRAGDVSVVANTAAGGQINFYGFDGTTWQPNMVIDQDGNVVIGQGTVPDGVALAVNGKIQSKEIKCTLNGWSDFVFADGYVLMPLAEVEQFIEANHHLPDVPSEQEVLNEGVDVAQMEAVLLQKIEELYLHMIALEKENMRLQHEVETLKAAAK